MKKILHLYGIPWMAGYFTEHNQVNIYAIKMAHKRIGTGNIIKGMYRL